MPPARPEPVPALDAARTEAPAFVRHLPCPSSMLGGGGLIMYIHLISRHDAARNWVSMHETVLAFDDIRQEFPVPSGGPPIRVLDGINFDVDSGKFIAVIGPSGCGKSTLLQMAAGLLAADAGDGAPPRPCGRLDQSRGRFVPHRPSSSHGRRSPKTSSCRCCCAASRRPSGASASHRSSRMSA